MSLTSKVVCHKSYGNLQLLLVPTHCWKNLFMNFVTELPDFTNWKGKIYNFILVIVDLLTKMVYYKPVKITFNAPSLAKVIINVVIRHHGLHSSIVSNRRSVFISKFWLFLYYFLSIKQTLPIVFHSQTNGQTKKKNIVE